MESNTLARPLPFLRGAISMCRSEFLRLGLSMLKIGTIGFGGGNALIPVIEEEVVDRQQIVSKREYDEDVVAACITPGALPVEIAAGVGSQTFGWRGMLFAASLMALPGVVLTIAILSLLSNAEASVLTGIQYVSLGLGAFIISLLIAYAIKTMQSAEGEPKATRAFMLVTMFAVFLLMGEKNLYKLFGISAQPLFHFSVLDILCLGFFLIVALAQKNKSFVSKLAIVGLAALFLLSGSTLLPLPLLHNVVSVVLFALILAAIGKDLRQGSQQEGTAVDGRKLTKKIVADTLIWTAFAVVLTVPAFVLLGGTTIAYAVTGFISSILSFGGGDAYLTLADGLFVTGGFLGAALFYGQLVPVANILPGSILCKILAGIGYFVGYEQAGIVGGLALALAGFGISIAASGMVFNVIAKLLQAFREVPSFQAISHGVRPLISGMLLNVALTMLNTNVKTGVALQLPNVEVLLISIGVAFLAGILLMKKKSSSGVMALSAVLGVGLTYL